MEGSLGPRHTTTWALLSRQMIGGMDSGEKLSLVTVPQHDGEWKVGRSRTMKEETGRGLEAFGAGWAF